MEQPTLTTPRLTLRQFEISDAPAVQRLADAKEIAATTLNIPHPYRDGMAENWIAEHTVHRQRGTDIHYALVLRETSDLIGAIGATFNRIHERAEIGYWIGVRYWNQGYCTEAATAFIAYLFEVVRVNKVTAAHMPRNPASGRVMEKLGMTQEGYLRSHYIKQGTPEDVIVYGLLARDWRVASGSRPEEFSA